MASRERVLITGGAGFVGSHLADTLAAAGHEVVLLDNLEPQVHGAIADGDRPAYLDPSHRLVRADVRDGASIGKLLEEVDVAYHLGAMVGVGQSMYEITRYVEVNTMGCAVLLQELVTRRDKIRKLIVASSMSIYGEGAYACTTHGIVAPRLRPTPQLAQHDWEVRCPQCGESMQPAPTNEDKPLYPTSVYAVTKRDHEELSLAFGLAYEMPTVALRFFNIYGSRQALSNPYTGVAAIFSGRMLGGQTPVIFEDGGQLRDFVHVSDIVQALKLSMDKPDADYQALNVGTGRAVSVKQVGEILAKELGWAGGFDITEQFRAGDIRHCYADISRIQQLLGYQPTVTFEQGVAELVAWVGNQQGVKNDGEKATNQLQQLGLVR